MWSEDYITTSGRTKTQARIEFVEFMHTKLVYDKIEFGIRRDALHRYTGPQSSPISIKLISEKYFVAPRNGSISVHNLGIETTTLTKWKVAIQIFMN